MYSAQFTQIPIQAAMRSDKLLTSQAHSNKAQKSISHLFIDPLSIRQPLKLDFTCELFVGSFSPCRNHTWGEGTGPIPRPATIPRCQPAPHSAQSKTVMVTETLQRALRMALGASGQTDWHDHSVKQFAPSKVDDAHAQDLPIPIPGIRLGNSPQCAP